MPDNQQTPQTDLREVAEDDVDGDEEPERDDSGGDSRLARVRQKLRERRKQNEKQRAKRQTKRKAKQKQRLRRRRELKKTGREAAKTAKSTRTGRAAGAIAGTIGSIAGTVAKGGKQASDAAQQAAERIDEVAPEDSDRGKRVDLDMDGEPDMAFRSASVDEPTVIDLDGDRDIDVGIAPADADERTGGGFGGGPTDIDELVDTGSGERPGMASQGDRLADAVSTALREGNVDVDVSVELEGGGQARPDGEVPAPGEPAGDGPWNVDADSFLNR